MCIPAFCPCIDKWLKRKFYLYSQITLLLQARQRILKQQRIAPGNRHGAAIHYVNKSSVRSLW